MAATPDDTSHTSSSTSEDSREEDDDRERPTLIILDIDGTLIDSVAYDEREKPEDRAVKREPDFVWRRSDAVYCRSHLSKFLRYCFESFDYVAIWTASGSMWATPIYEHIVNHVLDGDIEGETDSEWAPFLFVWDGTRTTRTLGGGSGWYESASFYSGNGGRETRKRLKKVYKAFPELNLTKERTLIVDDTPSTYADNYGNGVPMPTYDVLEEDFSGEIDNYLLYLTDYLETIRHKPNYRIVEKRGWFMRDCWGKEFVILRPSVIYVYTTDSLTFVALRSL